MSGVSKAGLQAYRCHYVEMGRVDYHAAWELQRRLADARAVGEIGDTLLVLEHPHTYTLGRSGHREHLLLSDSECAAQGIQVVEVDRGGDITYHGPGQMVVYPILYLGHPDASGRLPQVDYVGYLRRLEEVLIRTLAAFGIAGHRETGLTGVWVDSAGGPDKIAAIGVRVSAQGVSTHGVALNVAPDLGYFAGIVACGIVDKGVTSLHALLGERCPTMAETRRRFAAAFEAVFGCLLAPTSAAELMATTNRTRR
jgi:lipoate-protein ligase B